jgi:hypothetical protein
MGRLVFPSFLMVFITVLFASLVLPIGTDYNYNKGNQNVKDK